jgi:hypothetical protein
VKIVGLLTAVAISGLASAIALATSALISLSEVNLKAETLSGIGKLSLDSLFDGRLAGEFGWNQSSIRLLI